MQQQLNHPYKISEDKNLLQIGVIHTYLTQSYWAEGISKATVEKSILGAMCFGVYHKEDQIGFARVISDKATFAYLADVFILEPHRGQGLSKRLMEFILSHPELQGLRSWLLGTKDAHGLYAQYDFTPLPEPQRFMRRSGQLPIK
jgi:GNAT superfamily N-acetyltransferase